DAALAAGRAAQVRVAVEVAPGPALAVLVPGGVLGRPRAVPAHRPRAVPHREQEAVLLVRLRARAYGLEVAPHRLPGRLERLKQAAQVPGVGDPHVVVGLPPPPRAVEP